MTSARAVIWAAAVLHLKLEHRKPEDRVQKNEQLCWRRTAFSFLLLGLFRTTTVAAGLYRLRPGTAALAYVTAISYFWLLHTQLRSY